MRDETFVQLRLKTSTITSENTEEWQDEIKLATIGNTNKEVQLQNRNYNLMSKHLEKVMNWTWSSNTWENLREGLDKEEDNPANWPRIWLTGLCLVISTTKMASILSIKKCNRYLNCEYNCYKYRPRDWGLCNSL